MDRGPADELVDIVDADDRVVATVPRRRMRSENLRHRSVSIIVTASDGRLLVHRRAADKDVWPDQWDVCVGGVVGAGETYERAARRELAEEVGIRDAEPVFVSSGAYEDDHVRTLSRVYHVVHDGPYRFDDGEVADALLVDRDGLRALLATESFVPDSRSVVVPLLSRAAFDG